ncbi:MULTISPECIES: hypothetical protein [Sphingomonas]|uniref:hypothetical protein n=1 Tax=Sphingomonas TaxID=13687 RepID=UPI002413BC17|nr:hypothetical protein [Sphingomonas echinoides]
MTTKLNLGDKARHAITGLEGIVTARVEYLTGCAQVSLQPQGLTEQGKPFESFYFDEPYVDLVERQTVANRTPGRTDGATAAPGRNGNTPAPR